MTPLSCGYCGRRAPKRQEREHAVGSNGQPISPGYWQWTPGQAVCCNGQTAMPWGSGVRRVSLRVLGRLKKAADAAAKEGQTMLKKGEFTVGGTVKRDGGGRWRARLDVVMEGAAGPVLTVSETASNPHTAASRAVETAVCKLRARKNGTGAKR